ncbi:hypothetical protein DY000_02013396 [Brassica cretica]|uniref:NB-ARC domain-containing protein n=1 Tax=Brassica cretica TaxID=69181 RepID=A0ABQ7CP40_BRACR|nr:hypothetical protein DY000_02013396 [Brassica cretica]
MPGIGKTTIAQAGFNQMSHDFEVVCFLHDFHVMFHEKGLHILREEHSVEKLIGKTILVVLDDEVPSLNKKEAQQLFYGLAFPEEKPSDSKLVEASNKVVEYANGNPTALCLYGRELEGRTKEEEMEADFEKIKRQWPQREIIDMLKSSYDVLSDNERSIFLDVACFFNGEELDRIMQIFEGVISSLTDVAREIVSEENYQILRRRRLWDPSSIRLLLEDIEPKGTEVIEGIFLDTANLNVVVNPMAFENMYNLRLLKIYTSSSEPTQELHLPEGLSSLPYELKLLHWEHYLGERGRLPARAPPPLGRLGTDRRGSWVLGFAI